MNKELFKKELALHSFILASEEDKKFKELMGDIEKECGYSIDPSVFTMFADPITNLISLVKSAAHVMAVQLTKVPENASKEEYERTIELFKILLEKFYETKGLYDWQRESP